MAFVCNRYILAELGGPIEVISKKILSVSLLNLSYPVVEPNQVRVIRVYDLNELPDPNIEKLLGWTA